MPDIRDVYAEVDDLDLPQLHARREALMPSDKNFESLSDEALSELCAVNRALRRKTAANAGTRKAAVTRKKAPTDLEDLA